MRHGLFPIGMESTQDAISTAARFITDEQDHPKARELVAGSVRLLADYCHGLSAAAGWWTDPKTREPRVRVHGELLMLAASEISEAMEGVRKGLQDDKLPHRPMVEVELADCSIRCADMIGGLDLDDAADWVADGIPGIQSDYRWPPENTASSLAVISAELTKPVSPFAPAAPIAPEVLTRAVSYSLARCLLLGKSMGLDVPGAIAEKLAFNFHRPDHKLDARAAAGGKAF